jgi:hypothetical protein
MNQKHHGFATDSVANCEDDLCGWDLIVAGSEAGTTAEKHAADHVEETGHTVEVITAVREIQTFRP